MEGVLTAAFASHLLSHKLQMRAVELWTLQLQLSLILFPSIPLSRETIS